MDSSFDIKESISRIAERYAVALKRQTDLRKQEMATDDTSHNLIYRVLGVSAAEGQAIDLYQNQGRFLYKYAGAFLEEAARFCFQSRFPGVTSLNIANTLGTRPRTFQIDCLVDGDAYEIKWRDATTDGDHVLKEHERVRVIAAAGYRPVRLMFYYPNRRQARRIQAAIAELYKSVGGLYYAEAEAWQHLEARTGVNLRVILEEIVERQGA